MQLSIDTVVAEYQTRIGKPLKDQLIVLIFTLITISSFITFPNSQTPKLFQNKYYIVFSIYF